MADGSDIASEGAASRSSMYHGEGQGADLIRVECRHRHPFRTTSAGAIGGLRVDKRHFVTNNSQRVAPKRGRSHETNHRGYSSASLGER